MDQVKIAEFNYGIQINVCNIQCIFISSRALPPHYFGNAILSSHYVHLFNISELLTVNKMLSFYTLILVFIYLICYLLFLTHLRKEVYDMLETH